MIAKYIVPVAKFWVPAVRLISCFAADLIKARHYLQQRLLALA
jgi:hypothetical protein